METVKVQFVNGNDAADEFFGSVWAGSKTFSTGSRGYHATGQLMIGNKKYQINVQLVEVGSRPAPAKA